MVPLQIEQVVERDIAPRAPWTVESLPDRSIGCGIGEVDRVARALSGADLHADDAG